MRFAPTSLHEKAAAARLAFSSIPEYIRLRTVRRSARPRAAMASGCRTGARLVVSG